MSERIGRYEVLGELGAGGMAQILLCRATGPNGYERAVVLKRIHPHFARDEKFVSMFIDEARSLSRISHPNVIHVVEFASHGGDLYLTLEYVAGESLAGLAKRMVKRGEALSPALSAFIAAEACAGLHAAHESRGEDGQSLELVHRDVSPQNLLVSYDGHVKVLDFGIATTTSRIAKTEVGTVKGKLEYMSPEQTRGDALDRRTDIFSLGIVLYELSTGRRLYQRGGTVRVTDAICDEAPVPPTRFVDDYPRALEEICLRALEKAPVDRYQTAADMRRDLLALVRDLADPPAALAERMRELFADRVVEKQSMLRRLEAGEETLLVPSGEVDLDVTIPDAPLDPVEVTSTSPDTTARRRNGRLGLGLGVAFLVGSIVLASRWARPVASAAVAERDVPSAVASPAVAPQSAEVTVTIETKPLRALVAVGGEPRGKSPVVVTLKRGSGSVPLTVEHSGYHPLTREISTDRDQTMQLVLDPEPSAKPGGPRRKTPAPRASGKPFWRFD